jgi:hypothetical protein
MRDRKPERHRCEKSEKRPKTPLRRRTSRGVEGMPEEMVEQILDAMPEGIVEGMVKEIIESRGEGWARISLTRSLRGWTKRSSRRPRGSARRSPSGKS